MWITQDTHNDDVWVWDCLIGARTGCKSKETSNEVEKNFQEHIGLKYWSFLNLIPIN